MCPRSGRMDGSPSNTWSTRTGPPNPPQHLRRPNARTVGADRGPSSSWRHQPEQGRQRKAQQPQGPQAHEAGPCARDKTPTTAPKQPPASSSVTPTNAPPPSTRTRTPQDAMQSARARGQQPVRPPIPRASQPNKEVVCPVDPCLYLGDAALCNAASPRTTLGSQGVGRLIQPPPNCTPKQPPANRQGLPKSKLEVGLQLRATKPSSTSPVPDDGKVVANDTSRPPPRAQRCQGQAKPTPHRLRDLGKGRPRNGSPSAGEASRGTPATRGWHQRQPPVHPHCRQTRPRTATQRPPTPGPGSTGRGLHTRGPYQHEQPGGRRTPHKRRSE